MIFATAGTHEQQFDRLIRALDALRADGSITEDVIIQTGYSDYVPKHCIHSDFYSYRQMLEFVEEARIVVTHGGPSSFIMPLRIGKVPIVVPRKKEYGEHVNDHQVDFCRSAQMCQGNIIVVEDVDRLKDVIEHYDALAAEKCALLKSNNADFCAEFEKIIDSLTGGR